MKSLLEYTEIKELIEEYGEEKIKKIIRNRKSFCLYFDNFPNYKSFTDEQAGILFKNIIAFEKGENIERMDEYMGFAFTFIEPRLINGVVDYIHTSIKNAEKGSKGGKSRGNNIIPSQEEFINYCVSRGKEERYAEMIYKNITEKNEWGTFSDWREAEKRV